MSHETDKPQRETEQPTTAQGQEAAQSPETKEATSEATDGGTSSPQTSQASGGDERERLAAENAELKDKLLRAMADMENVHLRTEKEKADTAKFAISEFAREILKVADNLQRALEAVSKEELAANPALKALHEGVEMTDRELHNVLARHGITRIHPLGEKFDPNLHQAMFEVQDPSLADGAVAQVAQAGYLISGRVLRPAMVGVARGGPKAPPATSSEGSEEEAAANTASKGDAGPAPESPTGSQPQGAASDPQDQTPPAPGSKLDKNA